MRRFVECIALLGGLVLGLAAGGCNGQEAEDRRPRPAAPATPPVTVVAPPVTPVGDPGGTQIDEPGERPYRRPRKVRLRADAFVIEPYLQQPAPDGMTVMWSADTDQDVQIVYGPDEKMELRGRAASQRIESNYPQDPPEFLFRCRLGGLQPGARYRYRVSVGGAKREGTFRTAARGAKKFTFIAYGDTRYAEGHAEVAGEMARHDAELIIHTGDLVNMGEYYEYADVFFAPAARVFRNVPVMPAWGNHETDGAAMLKLFAMGEKGRLYHSFDYANAHFVALDSGVDESRHAGDMDEMLKWLDADLAASKADWKFVYYHYPTYDVGSYVSDWGREEVAPIFRRRGVDIAFAGHSHGYQRFDPLYVKGRNEDRPVTYIVTGAGGVFPSRVWVNPLLAAGRSAKHFMLLEIDGDTLRARAITSEGEAIDSFRITKRDGKVVGDYLAAAMPESAFDGDPRGKLEALVLALADAAELPPATPLPQAAGQGVGRSFELAGGQQEGQYRLELDEVSRDGWSMTPVTGNVPAGGTATVTYKVTAKAGGVRFLADSRDLAPVCRLKLTWRSGGREDSVVSRPLNVIDLNAPTRRPDLDEMEPPFP